MIVMMVGVELKSFNDQRGYTNEIVSKYIFPQYSFVSYFFLIFLLFLCVFYMLFMVFSGIQCGSNVIVMDTHFDWCVWNGVCNPFHLP